MFLIKSKNICFKKRKRFAGYFELILHQDKNEVEIAYLRFIRRISK